MAGDLFDHNRVEDDLLDFVLEQLHRNPIPVVILPGNHDCLSPGSVFLRRIWEKFDNLLVMRAINGQTVTLTNTGVTLWGKPIDSYERDVRPLQGLPRPPSDECWHVVVAHGHLADGDDSLFPSYHIAFDEIANSGWDYVALGHHVNFECVSEYPVRACYSGSASLSGTVVLAEFANQSSIEVRLVNL